MEKPHNQGELAQGKVVEPTSTILSENPSEHQDPSFAELEAEMRRQIEAERQEFGQDQDAGHEERIGNFGWLLANAVQWIRAVPITQATQGRYGLGDFEAAHARGDGRGAITVHTGYRHGGKVRAAKGHVLRGAPLEIRVQDNGPGVPAHLRESLFQPFVSTKLKGMSTSK